MKLLKCVGGVLDGKPVPPQLGNVDYFVVHADCFDELGSVGPASALAPETIDIHTYTRRVFRRSGEPAQVYALHTLTDNEVINRINQ